MEADFDVNKNTLTISPLHYYLEQFNAEGNDASISTTEKLIVSAFLHEQGTTRAQIEKWQHYFLYEKVLKDWVEGNGEYSRFTVAAMGILK